MTNAILKSTIILLCTSTMISCNSTNRLTVKNQQKVFTEEQIKEKLSQVRTGADFPVLVKNLKDLGVTYYETKMEDGSSVFHGENGYELITGPNYEPIIVADADNGINKWGVCLVSMTCTYIDKAGNKVWVEHIPNVYESKPLFTITQIKEAHSKVKSGADFPKYIHEIKALGVTAFETWVKDSHTDYSGTKAFQVSSEPMYTELIIADTTDKEKFEHYLKIHQQGKTDYLTFCNHCAETGIEKWFVCLDEMTCTYYSKKGDKVLVEHIPE